MRTAADIAQEDGVDCGRVLHIATYFVGCRYRILLELQQIVVGILQKDIRHEDHTMVALLSLAKMKVVLLGNLSFLLQKSPELRQNALVALRLIARRGNDEYGVLPLVRCHGVATQRVGLYDVYTIRYRYIGKGFTLAQYSSEDRYRIALNNLLRLDR